MSRRGNCWDNAVAESFFATVKVELAHDADWMTRAQARGEVFEYLERFYNGQRRPRTLWSPPARQQTQARHSDWFAVTTANRFPYLQF